jgi:uncharacterized membrane protein
MADVEADLPKSKWVSGMVALAAVGFALSLLLEWLHVRAHLAPNATSFCSVGDRIDCTSVALSPYSVLLGLPVPLWGALGFLTIGAAAWRRSAWLLPLTGAGAVASLVLLAVEVFAIGAVCLLCEAVHLLSLVSFGVAWRVRKQLAGTLTDRADWLSFLVPSALVAALLLLSVPHYWGVFGWKSKVPYPEGKTAEGYPWIGAAKPKLTVEEYIDYRCLHCRSASSRTLRRLSQNPNDLRIVRRQFPRQRCPTRANFGCVALRMAYCAQEQGEFWRADRWLFEHAPAVGSLEPRDMARDLGLDAAKVEACVNRRDVIDRAVTEAAAALDQKLTSTPTFMVEGKQVSEADLDRLLAR